MNMIEWMHDNIEEDVISGFNGENAILRNPELSDEDKKIAFIIAEQIYEVTLNDEPAQIYNGYDNGDSRIISGRIRIGLPQDDILFDLYGQQVGIIISEDLLTTDDWDRWCLITKAAMICAIGDMPIIDNMLGIKNSIGWNSLI